MGVPVVFLSALRQRLKALPGFRAHHKVPESAGQQAQKFVLSLAQPLLEEERERQFRCFRDTFRWKRKDLQISESASGFSIETPSFTYTVSLKLDASDTAFVLWERSLSGLSSKFSLAPPELFDLFPVKFDAIQTSFERAIDLESAIDRLEEKELSGVRIDYDSQCTLCEVHLLQIPAKILLTRKALTIERQGELTEADLLSLLLSLQGFFSGQTLRLSFQASEL